VVRRGTAPPTQPCSGPGRTSSATGWGRCSKALFHPLLGPARILSTPFPPPPLIASGSLGLDLLMSIAGEFSDENSKAIRRAFPKLRRFTIVAPETASHNCIGWSLCSPDYGWVWPGDDPEEYDILYGRFGWVQVKDCEPEAGMRRLALFRDRAGVTHAAKEVADSGWWESKLGRSFRVRHRLQELEGGPYGRVFRCYGRPEPNANWEKDSGSGGSSG